MRKLQLLHNVPSHCSLYFSNFILDFGSYLLVLRVTPGPPFKNYFWQCSGEAYGMPGIELWLDMCKVSALYPLYYLSNCIPLPSLKEDREKYFQFFPWSKASWGNQKSPEPQKFLRKHVHILSAPVASLTSAGCCLPGWVPNIFLHL